MRSCAARRAPARRLERAIGAQASGDGLRAPGRGRWVGRVRRSGVGGGACVAITSARTFHGRARRRVPRARGRGDASVRPGSAGEKRARPGRDGASHTCGSLQDDDLVWHSEPADRPAERRGRRCHRLERARIQCRLRAKRKYSCYSPLRVVTVGLATESRRSDGSPGAGGEPLRRASILGVGQAIRLTPPVPGRRAGGTVTLPCAIRHASGVGIVGRGLPAAAELSE